MMIGPPATPPLLPAPPPALPEAAEPPSTVNVWPHATDWPSLLVTTSRPELAPAGTVSAMLLSPPSATWAGLPPIVTAGFWLKPEPVMVTKPPGAAELGLTLEIWGAMLTLGPPVVAPS